MKLNINWKRIVPEPDPIYGHPLARSSHGISAISSSKDGNGATTRIYLYGGEHNARMPINDLQSTWCAEPVSPKSWKWRCITTPSSDNTKSIPPLRVAHAQCAIGSKIFIFGGRCGKSMGESSFNDLWELNCAVPGEETWKCIEYHAGVPPEPRSYHQMIAMPSENCVYVFGGCGANGRLADLHRFDITNSTWTTLSSASHVPSSLAGRGGSNLLAFDNSGKIAIIAGFVGHETNDGQIFDITSNKWDTHHVITFPDMQPRSVCSFVSGLSVKRGSDVIHDFSIIFGGEINASEKGHAGAGSFENDIWILDGLSISLVQRIAFRENDNINSWPTHRGWASATANHGSSNLYLFGGLSGDDENPIRLDDLWIGIFT